MRGAYNAVSVQCTVNASLGALYPVTFIPTGLCTNAEQSPFWWEVSAQRLSPKVCASNTTVATFPYNKSATFLLHAGSYQYELNGGGSFVGSNGTFTVGGPTTVYPEYTLTNQTFCEGGNDVAVNKTLNGLVPPSVQVTFVAHGLPQGQQRPWSVIITPLGTSSSTTQILNATWPSQGSITAQLQYGTYQIYGLSNCGGTAYSTYPKNSSALNALYIQVSASTPDSYQLNFIGMAGPVGSPSNAPCSQATTTTITTSTTAISSTFTTTTTIAQNGSAVCEKFLIFFGCGGDYEVTFTETGLPPTPGCWFSWDCGVLQWGVDFDGVVQNTTGASISNLYVQNGTYGYTVTAPQNYTANLTGVVKVDGTTVVTINFTKTSISENATTTCGGPVTPTLGSEGPCITVSASQCIGNIALCPNDSSPLYYALTLKLTPASNYYEMLTQAQVSGAVTNLSTSLSGHKITVFNLPNMSQPYAAIVVNNTATSTEDALGGLNFFLCGSEVAAVLTESLGAAAESGSSLVGLGEAAFKVSTEFTCHDTISALTNAGLYTDIDGQIAFSNTTVIAELKDGHVGLTTSAGGTDLDECQCLQVAGPYQQVDLVMKLSGSVEQDLLPVSGAGYVFANPADIGGLGPACGANKGQCITVITANFSQKVDVGAT